MNIHTPKTTYNHISKAKLVELLEKKSADYLKLVHDQARLVRENRELFGRVQNLEAQLSDERDGDWQEKYEEELHDRLENLRNGRPELEGVKQYYRDRETGELAILKSQEAA